MTPFRSAIPTLIPARHNLALLLVSEKKQPEAIELWRANLRESSDYLPSRLSLAETLTASGDLAGAIEQYRQVLALKPGYIAARASRWRRLLAKSGDAPAALTELRMIVQAEPQNAAVLEQIGDVESAAGHAAEARQAYTSALQATDDRGAKKRIQNKLRAL